MQRSVFLPAGLIRFALRTILKRRWQSLLMIVGIMLGVAVMVSIDLANASAGRAFELSAEAVTGKATHQIVSSGILLDEQVYVDLRRMGLTRLAAPVITAYVGVPALGPQPFQLMGIDPFVDGYFRDFWNASGDLSGDGLIEFLTQPGSVYLSKGVAESSDLKMGDRFGLLLDGRSLEVRVAGVIQPGDRLARRFLDGVILTDIATAQELSGKIGQIDRIDLILANDAGGIKEAIEAMLPEGAQLVPVEARQGTIEEMTAAFRLNLSALSLLALVVGLFLIYNTMTFSVVQRRDLFGSLRCMGVTRREIFLLVAGEALVVGVLGSLGGIGLGILMGRNTIGMVSQTINDLYFTTTVRDVGLPLASLVKGGVLGVLATLAAALPPALEAASVEPKMALLRSGLEHKSRLVVWLLALAGLFLIICGLVFFQVPGDNIFFGFGGTFLVVVGLAMTAALMMRFLMIGLAPLSGRMFGLMGRMAPRSLVNTLSRTAVAVAALMVAVAVTIGVSLMIDSFRYTVTLWLEQTLQSDIYISAPSFTATTSLTTIDPRVVTQAGQFEGIQRVDLLRTTRVVTTFGDVQISATSNPDISEERLFKEAIGDDQTIRRAMLDGAVIVSEPLANRYNLRAGERLAIQSPGGEVQALIAGIFYDYASSEGSLMMLLENYRRDWQDEAVTAIGLRLTPGSDVDGVVDRLNRAMQTDQSVIIRANATLREEVMEVFDRTFAITAALRILATVVAFIGILSTLLLLQLEKQREVGILKALGLTGRDLWKLVMLETGLMGLVAGILAAPTGYVLALILIHVINLRSFGWTLQLSLQPQAFLFAIGIAMGAALLAGIAPAIRLGRMSAAEVIRYE